MDQRLGRSGRAERPTHGAACSETGRVRALTLIRTPWQLADNSRAATLATAPHLTLEHDHPCPDHRQSAPLPLGHNLPCSNHRQGAPLPLKYNHPRSDHRKSPRALKCDHPCPGHRKSVPLADPTARPHTHAPLRTHVRTQLRHR